MLPLFIAKKGDELMINIVSFSGGKDSSAMLLMMLERGIPIDYIVFCDTGMEFPEMYEHLDKVEQYIGRKITRLKAEHSFEHYMFDHEKTSGKNKGQHGYGWGSMRIRWCTYLLKEQIFDRFKASLGEPSQQFVGIAADEPKRIKDKRYLLVEWGITEAMALQYCKERGFDWGGLYDHLDRVSCWCCPLKNLREIKVIRDYHPALWQRLREMDEASPNQFRADYSVAQLEIKFSIEDEAIKQGLNPRSREVQRRVKEALKLR